MRTIKLSPKKLDTLADEYFKKAEGGREDFSSLEWIEIQELSGLALRRWAAQLRDGAAAQRARDKDYVEFVQLAAALFRGERPSPGDSPLHAEVFSAFMEDPAPVSDLSLEDREEALMLYVLFYAAAKRSGGL